MAFKSSIGLWRKLISSGVSREGGSARNVTSTLQKSKAYNSPTADYAHVHPQHQTQTGQGKSSRLMKGDFVPVYVAIGMITLSVMLGLHTAKQQLMHSPTVFVKKQRRETLPEVVEPEQVVEEAENFFRKSFFRKVADVLEYNNPQKQVISNPISKDAFVHKPHAETLKSVGIDPKHV